MLEAMHYVDRGYGQPVVFSHGTLMDWSMFNPQLAALEDRYRVVAFNHRARTADYISSYKLDDLVEDCRAFLDQLEINRCVLAGMSMGGFMALEFALRYPERLNGLILISTYAGAYSAEERQQYDEAFGALNTDGLVPRPFAEWVAGLCFGPSTHADNPALISKWVDKWCEIPARSVYCEANSWLDKRDLTAELQHLSIPSLIVHGQEDAVLPLSHATQPMADGLPDVAMTPVPRAGHTVNLEQVETVNVAIDQFLRSRIA
jgi:pimeloyl-ACP methyl ester carboxylesterase